MFLSQAEVGRISAENILFALVLIFFRFSDNDPSDGKYTPPQFKDGKIISPKTR